MQKNVAGQAIGAQMVSATDGSAFTGTVTVYVTGDASTQALGSVGSGVCTHEGNGYHTYAPSQAETNYGVIAFTFIGTGAVPVTLQVFTRVDANAIEISGDATAADNLEAAFDGTGGVTISAGLSGNVTGNLSGSVGSVTGAVGSVTGSVGSISGITFPSNFASLGINVSGHLSRVTLVDTTTTNTDMRGTDSAYTGTPPTAAAIADQVWDENLNQHVAAGTTGGALTSVLVDTEVTIPALIPSAATIATQVDATLTSSHGSGAWTTATGFSTHAAADVITALGSGTQVFGHSYLAAIKRIEVASGNSTLTGAGTGTEVLTSEDSSLTATYTVDGSGNISAIVWA